MKFLVKQVSFTILFSWTGRRNYIGLVLGLFLTMVGTELKNFSLQQNPRQACCCIFKIKTFEFSSPASSATDSNQKLYSCTSIDADNLYSVKMLLFCQSKIIYSELSITRNSVELENLENFKIQQKIIISAIYKCFRVKRSVQP